MSAVNDSQRVADNVRKQKKRAVCEWSSESYKALSGHDLTMGLPLYDTAQCSKHQRHTEGLNVKHNSDLGSTAICTQSACDIDKLPILQAHLIGELPHLPSDIKTLLNLNLKFIPDVQPSVHNIQKDVLRATDKFTRNIRLRFMFQTDTDVPKLRVPNPNYTPDMAPDDVESFLLDLKSELLSEVKDHSQSVIHRSHGSHLSRAINKLRNMKNDIIIKPADKNLGIAITSKTWYEQEAVRQLSDETTYTKISEAEFDIIQSQLCTRLVNLTSKFEHRPLSPGIIKFITNSIIDYKLPDFYMIIKVHKDPVAGRPIVPQHSWLTSNLSRYLAVELNKVVVNLPEKSVLQGSKELLITLEPMWVPQSATLFTFDVVNLYPNLDTETTVNNVLKIMGDRHHHIQELLTFVMQNNYFKFGTQIYKQNTGCAMGTAVAPPYANLGLATDEREIFKPYSSFIILYRRFIDDGFGIWNGPLQLLHEMLQAYNTHRERIKITHTISANEVNFLDLTIYKDYGTRNSEGLVKISTKTFEKPLNKYLYVPRMSCHPPHTLSGFIKGEMIRYLISNTKKKHFRKAVHRFTKRLVQRGYARTEIDAISRQITFGQRQDRLHQAARKTMQQGHAPLLCLTYNRIIGKVNLRRAAKKIFDKYKHIPNVADVLQHKPPMISYRVHKNLQKLLTRASD